MQMKIPESKTIGDILSLLFWYNSEKEISARGFWIWIFGFVFLERGLDDFRGEFFRDLDFFCAFDGVGLLEGMGIDY